MTWNCAVKAVVYLFRGWSLALFLTFCVPAVTRAGLITNVSGGAVQDPSRGLYVYSYTVTNLPGSTDTLGGLTVNVDPSADISAIFGPPGWQSSFDMADALVLWVSADPSTDILPSSFGIFSFRSPLPPVPQDYLAIGFSDFGIDFNTGTTVGPGASPSTVVPEPGSLLVFGVGLLGVLSYRWKRRKPAAVL